MAQFKVGDVVELKSRGPKMTVEEVKTGDKVLCVWFDGSTEKRGVFPADTLQVPPKRGLAANLD